MSIEELVREELNLEIPDPVTPLGKYIPAILIGDLIFVSGQLPIIDGNLIYKGILGQNVNIEQGYEAARICALNSLSAIKSVFPDLNNIKRIVKLNGYVSSDEKFHDQPKVINGASDFFFNVFGNKGRHARSAIGVPSLPMGSCVEIDLIAEI